MAKSPRKVCYLRTFCRKFRRNGIISTWVHSKGHNQYNESTMGYVGNGGDDLSGVFLKMREAGTYHNLVGFMESHDEERLMYNNMLYGNSSGTYNVKDLETSLKRMGQAAAFFFTVPGPKLMWQFGELGYDYSINFPSNTSESRTAPKPVKWDYKNDYYRYNLFLEYSALIKLKLIIPHLELTIEWKLGEHKNKFILMILK